MKGFKIITILLIGIIMNSCNQKNMKEESALLFPKGVKIENNNFTGNAYLQNSVGSVTFEPGARTNWHSHPNGQIIVAVDGEGYYQEKGSPKRILKKGDAVKCPANIPHWHGASENNKFIQIAITSRVDGPTEWLEKVEDTEYSN